MAESTHRVDVVEVHPLPHPNADKMELCNIWGFTCCIGKGQFKDGDLAAYIQPDSMVKTTRPEFAFLAKEGRTEERIKVKKLRGVISMGLIIPAPEGSKVGDNVAEILEVTHYEPPLPISTGGDIATPPPGYHPNYDVEAMRRYLHLFEPGESVFVTEKIHGANGRWCFSPVSEVDDSRMEEEHHLLTGFHAGSRTTWKKYNPDNIWWKVLEEYEDVANFLRNNPDITMYGEVYGQVQDLKYGVLRGVRLAAFDLLRGTQWIDPLEARALAPMLPWVPTVAAGIPFYFDRLCGLADGMSLIPDSNNVREGIVVKPMQERTHQEIGRVQLKLVSNTYLERA